MIGRNYLRQKICFNESFSLHFEMLILTGNQLHQMTNLFGYVGCVKNGYLITISDPGVDWFMIGSGHWLAGWPVTWGLLRYHLYELEEDLRVYLWMGIVVWM